ncbi:hypothetical protein ALQ30_200613 [Pseudomonas syringae pv. persicae]|uniref:Uncharacterized protein n=1 Tax=Pseudomonas syringae pv. persicae TaxID=237306 RepID=A0A3M4AV10_9PSED|nr:hypothetical protein ALQ30_200613 [Pseudomonas syringae pv. persicae]
MVDHQLGKPCCTQGVQEVLDQRNTARTHQRLGCMQGQRAHSLAFAGGENHRFHAVLFKQSISHSTWQSLKAAAFHNGQPLRQLFLPAAANWSAIDPIGPAPGASTTLLRIKQKSAGRLPDSEACRRDDRSARKSRSPSDDAVRPSDHWRARKLQNLPAPGYPAYSPDPSKS